MKSVKLLGERETHPYGIWVPPGARSLIVGSFPIAKFTDPKRKSEIDDKTEINFYYGGASNRLWRCLGEAFETELRTEGQIRNFLSAQNIGIGDVVQACRRLGGGSQDSDLKEKEWNHELLVAVRENKIQTLYFTSKKVAQWFESHIGDVANLQTFVLPSPSQSAVRSQRFYPEFVKRKQLDLDYNFDRYRTDVYRRIFAKKQSR